jgi:hypothetical protein
VDWEAALGRARTPGSFRRTKDAAALNQSSLVKKLSGARSEAPFATSTSIPPAHGDRSRFEALPDDSDVEGQLADILEQSGLLNTVAEEQLIEEARTARDREGVHQEEDSSGAESDSSSSDASAGYVSFGDDELPLVPVKRIRTVDGPWQKGPLYDSRGVLVGHLVYDEVHGQLDGQCCFHKGSPKCHVHKVLRKRPVGYIAAWLLHGLCCSSRGIHFGSRTERASDQACGFEARVKARRLVMSQPHLEFFLELER